MKYIALSRRVLSVFTQPNNSVKAGYGVIDILTGSDMGNTPLKSRM